MLTRDELDRAIDKEACTIRKLSRREAVAGAGLTVAGFALGFATKSFMPAPTPSTQGSVSTPDEALERLKEGNRRYVAGTPIHPNQSLQLRQQLAADQHPWAAILGCIDSRVPPEMIFDQGLGDLFVSRTAGQVIDEAVLGSIEYAVEEGVKLIMVLGHQNCGAVEATIQVLETNGHAEGSINALVEAITPAVEIAKAQPGDLSDNTVRANTALEVEKLKSSEIVSNALRDGTMKLVAARYGLDTGAVEILTT